MYTRSFHTSFFFFFLLTHVLCCCSFTQDLVASMEHDGIPVSSVKLEGSGASHVINSGAFARFNDIDIAIYLKDQSHMSLRNVRRVLFDVINEQLVSKSKGNVMHSDWPAPFMRKMWITPYTGDPREDSWAIFTIGFPDATFGNTVDIDIKVIQRIARPYQFTIDSLRIDFTPLVLQGTKSDTEPQPKSASSSSSSSSEGESMRRADKPKPKACSWADVAKRRASLSTGECGEADMAPVLRYESAIGYEDVDLVLDHLTKRYISINNEDELASVRGGGLLKFVGYLQKGFSVDPSVVQMRLHKYMVTRFLMDYPSHKMTTRGLAQLQVLSDYLTTHYPLCGNNTNTHAEGDVKQMRRRFLMEVHRIVAGVRSHVNLCEPLLDVISYLLGVADGSCAAHYTHTHTPSLSVGDDSDCSSVASEDSGVSLTDATTHTTTHSDERSNAKPPQGKGKGKRRYKGKNKHKNNNTGATRGAHTRTQTHQHVNR